MEWQRLVSVDSEGWAEKVGEYKIVDVKIDYETQTERGSLLYVVAVTSIESTQDIKSAIGDTFSTDYWDSHEGPRFYFDGADLLASGKTAENKKLTFWRVHMVTVF